MSRGDPGQIWLWTGYADRGVARSLMRRVEENGESLRRRFSTWIHDLGETLLDGKRVIDHFQATDDGFASGG